MWMYQATESGPCNPPKPCQRPIPSRTVRQDERPDFGAVLLGVTRVPVRLAFSGWAILAPLCERFCRLARTCLAVPHFFGTVWAGRCVLVVPFSVSSSSVSVARAGGSRAPVPISVGHACASWLGSGPRGVAGSLRSSAGSAGGCAAIVFWSSLMMMSFSRDIRRLSSRHLWISANCCLTATN